MSLTINGAAVDWRLVAQLAAPAASKLEGAGGPAQPNLRGLLVVTPSASWTLVPLLPTTSKMDATLGPAQAYASSFILVGTAASWTLAGRLAQPKITAQRGPGGVTQGNAASLLIMGTAASWNLSARLFAARLTYLIAADGFTVQFTSTSGDAPGSIGWDFGDGTAGSGTPASHIFSDFGSFTIALTITRVRGFEAAPLTSRASHLVTISAAAQPDESLDDVLNLEGGLHAYEPIRTASSDVGENVSHFNEVRNLPAGQIQTLLFFTPAQTIRVRQVTATGTGDGLFKLLLNGQVIDAKRSYATQRNVRFDVEEGLKLTVTDTLEVRVTNSSALAQSYEASLLGRTL